MHASTLLTPLQTSYFYIGQKVIDVSDEYLPSLVAKIMNQFVIHLPTIACLMAVPVKLTLACTAAYVVTQDLDCNDETCAQVVTTISCVCILKALANIYRLSQACSLATLAVVVIQITAACACQSTISLLEIDED